MPLDEDYSRKKTERDKWLPAAISKEGRVVTTGYHGSAHIHALSFSDVMVKVPRGVAEIKKGELVYVRQI